MKLLTAILLAGAMSFGFSVTAAAQCSDDCPSSNDGECDDGGIDSLYDICAIGTDCSDCGVRVCDNSCPSSFDGECDDGGIGALYDICGYGTDCGDCGVR